MRLAMIFDRTAEVVRQGVLALTVMLTTLSGPSAVAALAAPDAANPSEGTAAVRAEEELVPFKVEDGATLKVIKEPLGGLVGDAETGRQLFVDRAKGNCLACHGAAAIPELKFQGDVGSALDGVASRFNEAELRLILVDPKLNYPRTVMPAYYRIQGLTRVHPKLTSRPLLNAQEVEDLLAFLMTLK